MSDDHPHEWTDWVMRVPVRDYTGRVIADGNWATLRGGRPVTPGWARTCRICGQRETT